LIDFVDATNDVTNQSKPPFQLGILEIKRRQQVTYTTTRKVHSARKIHPNMAKQTRIFSKIRKIISAQIINVELGIITPMASATKVFEKWSKQQVVLYL